MNSQVTHNESEELGEDDVQLFTVIKGTNYFFNSKNVLASGATAQILELFRRQGDGFIWTGMIAKSIEMPAVTTEEGTVTYADEMSERLEVINNELKLQHEAHQALPLKLRRHIAFPLATAEGPKGKFYLIMDLVNGQSLQQFKLNTDNVETYCSSMQSLAVAIDFMNQIVNHRDIKPANIIVKGDGTAVLIDFGFANFKNSEQVSMTPLYASPEQIGFNTFSHSADVYSFMATVAHFLVGISEDYSPFKRDSQFLGEERRVTDKEEVILNVNMLGEEESDLRDDYVQNLFRNIQKIRGLEYSEDDEIPEEIQLISKILKKCLIKSEDLRFKNAALPALIVLELFSGLFIADYDTSLASSIARYALDKTDENKDDLLLKFEKDLESNVKLKQILSDLVKLEKYETLGSDNFDDFIKMLE